MKVLLFIVVALICAVARANHQKISTFKYNGHEYELYFIQTTSTPNQVTWAEARAEAGAMFNAEKRQGYLASPQSLAENKKIFEAVQAAGGSGADYWIGLSDLGSVNNFKFSGGSLSGQAPQQPQWSSTGNSVGGGCVAMKQENGLWVKRLCDGKSPAMIVEYGNDCDIWFSTQSNQGCPEGKNKKEAQFLDAEICGSSCNVDKCCTDQPPPPKELRSCKDIEFTPCPPPLLKRRLSTQCLGPCTNASCCADEETIAAEQQEESLANKKPDPDALDWNIVMYCGIGFVVVLAMTLVFCYNHSNKPKFRRVGRDFGADFAVNPIYNF